jgi:hypothetical protein
MFAIVAAVLFGVGLILHLVGGSAASHVTDFELAGLLCIALHLIFGTIGAITFRRPAP